MKTEIIIPAGAIVGVRKDPVGWGSGFECVEVSGRAVSFTIRPADTAKFGGVCIRISEEGDLTITCYGGSYKTMVPQNLKLENGRPWRDCE